MICSWKDQKNRLCWLIKCLSDYYWYDDEEFLREYCKEIIEKYKTDLSIPIKCFEDLIKQCGIDFKEPKKQKPIGSNYMIRFETWLKKQKDRDDNIGDLARDYIEDGAPKLLDEKYLLSKNACDDALDSLKEAKKEFEQYKNFPVACQKCGYRPIFCHCT